MTNKIDLKKSKYKPKKKSIILETLQRTVKSPSSKFGVGLIVIIVLLCVFGSFFLPYGPNDMDLLNINKGPSSLHWCGTDSLGRDLLTRLLYGGRYSLTLGIFTSLLSSFIGVIFGCMAGYFGGKVEMTIMRLMDVWSALPGMLLCILISATLGAGFINTIIALAIGAIPNGTRLTRGQILGERGKEYLEAAESINCKKTTIMFSHLLPNVIAPTIVNMTMSIGSTITMAATLSYIGLGVQPPTPEWGAMLSAGRTYIRTFPHLIMFPGIAIALTVLAINLMGDGLRDALDPKLRS